jgi:hypothetical protein
MHNLRHLDSFSFNAESGLSISQYLQIYPLFILLKYNQGYVTSYYKRQYRNSQASIVEGAGNKRGNGDEFPDNDDLLFFLP